MRPPLHVVSLGILLLFFLCAADYPHVIQETGSRHDAIQPLISKGETVAAVSVAVEELHRQFAANGPRSLATLDAIGDVATTLRELGDFELAGAVWQVYRVSAAAIAGPRDVRVARAIYNLGVTSKGTSSEYDDILPYYQKALSLLDSNNPNHAILIAEITRSEGHYYRYRDRAKSVAKLREALSMFERAGAQAEATDTRVWLAWTQLQLGEHAIAQRELERARRDLVRLGMTHHLLMGVVESALADLMVLENDWRGAEMGYRRATRIFEQFRKSSSTRFAEVPLHAYNLLALTLIKQNRADEAWIPLQRYRSPTGVRLLGLSEWWKRAPESFARVQNVREHVIKQRGLRRIDANSLSFERVDWKEMIDELSANADLARMESNYDAPDIAGSMTLSDLQSVLPDDWAYVGYMDSRVGDELLCSSSNIMDTRWMFVVRSRGPVQWVPLWEYLTPNDRHINRHIADEYTYLLNGATTWSLRVTDDPAMMRCARRLESQELEPAMQYLAGVNHLVMEFYEEPYGWRPLECLVLPNGRYVGERFAVSYSLSAAFFTHSRRTSAGASDGLVLAVGDPIFDPSGRQSRPTAPDRIDYTHLRAATNGDQNVLDHLPRLPFADREMKTLRNVYPGCTILSGLDATESNVRSLFDRNDSAHYNVIHFSTHALADTPIRQRCALALSRQGVDRTPQNDGLVDALEIQLGWRLDANLVTLGGCQTASGWSFFRGEPGGLAGVLLGTGARSVIASVWKVDDLATTMLMGRFYENLSGRYSAVRAGRARVAMPKDVALAEAKDWLRTYTDKNGDKPFAHPVYWSGFILMGDPD